MEKPFYKRWIFWAIVIVVGGIIGLTTGNDDPAEQAAPAPTEEAQPAVVEPTAEASAGPTAVPTEAPAASPSPEATPADNDSVSWESAVKQIAQSDTSSTQKADASEVLARDYKPSADELKDFESQIVEEYNAGNYLAQIDDSEYMLTNIFKATVVERNHTDGEPIKEFAFDFYQNTKYTYRGADAVDSDSVKSNESQMDKALANIK